MTTHATTRPSLNLLADHLGIQPSYVDQTGETLRFTSDATREALLAAMGFDASTEEQTAAALRALRDVERRQWIAPVRVVRQRSRALSRGLRSVAGFPFCTGHCAHYQCLKSCVGAPLSGHAGGRAEDRRDRAA